MVMVAIMKSINFGLLDSWMKHSPQHDPLIRGPLLAAPALAFEIALSIGPNIFQS
jgi:hypothetical protein